MLGGGGGGRKTIFLFLETNVFGIYQAICVKYERGFSANTLEFLTYPFYEISKLDHFYG
jgi:hypothetical protein